jgi:putative restriction endonuclease
MQPFVANTDKAWFDYLSRRAADGRIDEANFWSPQANRPIADLAPGTPFFLRLKEPHAAIAGYGFFAEFALLDLDEAWTVFDWKNGDPDALRFFGRLGGYRRLDLLDPRSPRSPLACTILRDVRFWPSSAWIPWSEAQGWQRNIVRGKAERDPARAALLRASIVEDATHREVQREFTGAFVPLDADERAVVVSKSVVREGQGAFRTRVLDAYGRRCSISGERTEVVLQAAHIQPYLGPRSNHLQNGIAMTVEFHTLFDRGLIGITPEYRVRVSPAIKQRWSNGRRYYEFDGRPLSQLPSAADARPSAEALEWRMKTLYVA